MIFGVPFSHQYDQNFGYLLTGDNINANNETLGTSNVRHIEVLDNFSLNYPGRPATNTYERGSYFATGDEYIIPPGGGSAFASGLSGTVIDDFGFIGSQNIQRPGGQIEVFPEGCPTNVDVTFRVMCKDYWTMGSNPCPIDVADRPVVAVELLDEAGTLMQSYAYDQLWGPGLNFFEQTITYQLDAGTYTIKAHNIVDGNGVTKYYGEVSVSYAPQCDLATTMTTNQVNFNQVAGGPG